MKLSDAGPGGVWLAAKSCGCIVGACRETNDPAMREHNDIEILKWLHHGCIVRLVDRAEWEAQETRDAFLRYCTHEQPQPVSVPV